MLMVAGSQSLRHQNRSLILAVLRERGPMAHTDISEWTGLSSATVSAITADLLDEDIIQRQEAPAKSGRGRPRVLFVHNPDAAYVMAARITSRDIEYSLADYAGTLKDRFSVDRPPDETDPSKFLIRFLDGLEKLLERSGLHRNKIRSISITSKGLVASGRAVLLWSPVFGDKSIDFETALADGWPCRVSLSNETQLASEAVVALAKADTPDFRKKTVVTLSLGHSIGLGIATLNPGSKVTSTSPSFGHMTHMPDGPVCRCGARGCIEAYAGFYGILRTAFEVPYQTIPTNFVPLAEIEKIADNARRGDRMAEFAFRQAGEVLGTGVSRLMSLYHPMPLAITGPGLRYFDLMQKSFETPLRDNLEIRFQKFPEITLHPDEANLVYDGNVAHTLSHLDNSVLAYGSAGD